MGDNSRAIYTKQPRLAAGLAGPVTNPPCCILHELHTHTCTCTCLVEELEGYENNWFCDYNENHYAYVDGGMNFTQSDKKLHVPVCGYYYISSQIYFQINNNTRNNTQYAFHEIKVNRNCPQNRPDMVTLKSYSSLGALSEEARFSTYIGDIVKMCTGGTIEVAISKINPCCPYGTNSYVAAHLVAETSCDWKPKKLMP